MKVPDPFEKPAWKPDLRRARSFWGPRASGEIWVHDITGWPLEDVCSAIAEHGIEGAVIDYDYSPRGWDLPIAVMVWPVREES